MRCVALLFEDLLYEYLGSSQFVSSQKHVIFGFSVLLQADCVEMYFAIFVFNQACYHFGLNDEHVRTMFMDF